MSRQWTFGQKIAAGFAAETALALLIAVVGIYTLNQAVQAKDGVIEVYARNLVHAESLAGVLEQKVSAARGYLLSGDDRHLDEVRRHRTQFADILAQIKANVDTEQGRKFAANIERLEAEHQARLERTFQMRKAGAPLQQVADTFEKTVVPARDDMAAEQARFIEFDERLLQEGTAKSTQDADNAQTVLAGVAAAAVLMAILMAVLLGRGIARQLGATVQHVQSSSAELQSAATEQSATSTEQKSAVTEATTTLKELVATSRQMAESAQRVTRIAEETASSARTGDQTVQNAQDAINGIKRQVELIVGHMLDLGKKSQQVGGVLELINELAEQTNILAINATIESAGAGETGKRFAVVAEEIRKLADRVAGSTKEIRTLIDEIRSAANTTVMATEDGAKAVDVGTRQFGEVATAFRQIAERVQTTTDASREIELGTRQQVTAVDQVSTALQGILQAATQTETSTRQTLETSTQLASLSRNLLQLIQPAPA